MKGKVVALLHKESTIGILLIIATLLALFLENSPLSSFYDSFLHTPVEIRFGALHIAKPLLLWVNDGLMAVFFFYVGLEIKREIVDGHLSQISQMTFPAIAALGGMVVPALLFASLNFHDEKALNGWAIPTATDIAFALGVLSLLGNRIPFSLKVFLMTLAIVDDLGAIIVIALFYTTKLSLTSLVVASIALTILFIMNRMCVISKGAYILVGVALWVSVLKSGVHATLAGVALALLIPYRINKNGKIYELTKQMEHGLHLWVNFFILPLFAFANAGVNLQNISMSELFGSVPMGIMLGLFIGKQLGVFGFGYLAVKLKIAKLPKESTLIQFYGVAVLAGIGFTMSLFIDSLAYEDAQIYQYADKLAVLIGSLLSGIWGYIVLSKSSAP
ncbi:Na+/H+ antiporter NhaA [Nitratiruptor sp. SB155-2]|uniref:Na(+)/H(+) antiporter NhaA n=1 Tax=Nitratiruptor sp. (strain SB155-2) TaxID=387092 RepID=NHAA_NITSB|nr:Na+/H+ antiporter NhaA [Nitratiruptor sp. SB155-2]A6Q0Z0.1 RecName: Full=Na(+)/H(+) antiporter NhaA; AltName: Full=Sodium/proton antiporter NhaA [Nitratiruptor sp. SB155-2]BAF69149.1 Na+:H+ antiporter, NhaA family [Nitratiruptor sp. SB155-2]